MIIDEKLSFGGYAPFSNCDLCGARTDNRGICVGCAQDYDHDVRAYNFPEPFTRETFTPTRWKELQRIQKQGEAAGKTQHDINLEKFKYAYRVSRRAADSAISPYLDICDIPTAPIPNSIHRGYNVTCPICGSDTCDSSFCTTCAHLYSEERFYQLFPAPFTHRIFSFQNWEDIQLIKKRGAKLGKSQAEIDQAISDYAEAAVADMQAHASSHTDVGKNFFPLPESSPPQLQSAHTNPSPQTTTPTAKQPNSPQTSSQPTQLQKHSKLDLILLSLAEKYSLYVRVNFMRGSCYICHKRYWTTAAARKCCAEAKKTTPPEPPRFRAPLIQTQSQYRKTNPCPVCHGEGNIRGMMCPDCDGRGSLRLW